MKAGSVAAAVVFFAAGYVTGCDATGNRVEPSPPDVRVLVAHDTVRIVSPAPALVRDVTAETARLPVVSEPEAGCDSAEVYVPRSQAVFAGESYRAYVSGYRPRLDSLVMLRSTTAVSVSAPTASVRRESRFSIGLQAGYGITPKGLQPYVGVGVSVRLAAF